MFFGLVSLGFPFVSYGKQTSSEEIPSEEEINEAISVLQKWYWIWKNQDYSYFTSYVFETALGIDKKEQAENMVNEIQQYFNFQISKYPSYWFEKGIKVAPQFVELPMLQKLTMFYELKCVTEKYKEKLSQPFDRPKEFDEGGSFCRY